MKRFELQGDHRQGLEQKVVTGNLEAAKRGQTFAFVLALLAMGGGLGLIASGKSIEGYVTLVLYATYLSAVFVGGKVVDLIERATKRKELDQHKPRD